MEVIDLKLHDLPHLTDNYVVAMGFFDGLHLGHQKLIEEVKRVSVKKNYKSACCFKRGRKTLSDK